MKKDDKTSVPDHVVRAYEARMEPLVQYYMTRIREGLPLPPLVLHKPAGESRWLAVDVDSLAICEAGNRLGVKDGFAAYKLNGNLSDEKLRSLMETLKALRREERATLDPGTPV
jgi:hypothetical protein